MNRKDNNELKQKGELIKTINNKPSLNIKRDVKNILKQIQSINNKNLRLTFLKSLSLAVKTDNPAQINKVIKGIKAIINEIRVQSGNIINKNDINDYLINHENELMKIANIYLVSSVKRIKHCKELRANASNKDQIRAINREEKLGNYADLSMRYKYLTKYYKQVNSDRAIYFSTGAWATKQMPKTLKLAHMAISPRSDVYSGNLANNYLKQYEVVPASDVAMLKAQIVKLEHRNELNALYEYYHPSKFSNITVSKITTKYGLHGLNIIKRLRNSKALISFYNYEFGEHRFIGESRSKAKKINNSSEIKKAKKDKVI